MSPEPINQQDPDTFFEIVPEANQETIDDFLKTLEGEFDYPAFSHLSSQSDEDIANEIVGETEEDDDDETPDDQTEEIESPSTEDKSIDQTPPNTVMVNGNPVLMEDVQRLYEFDQYLRQNPEAAQRVQQAVTPPPIPTPVQPTPTAETNEGLTPPDFLDMDDPAHKFMWDSHVAQQRQLQSFQQAQAQREQESLNQKAAMEMDTALSRFRSSHPAFNDDQIQDLRRHAASMNIASSVMATSTNPVDGFVRILDLASLDHPDLRNVYLAPSESKTPTRKQRSTERKGKLSALGGSSGSAPRTTPSHRPMSDREAINQFAQELSEQFQQN